MTRIHIATSPEPLRFGENLTALCGETIGHAQPVNLAEESEPGSALSYCRICFGMWRYVGQVVSGEESLHMEVTA
jgi:hypothetical protein